MKSKPPPSASSFVINLFGGFCYLFALLISRYFFPDIGLAELGLIGIATAVIVIFSCEILFLKVHRRARVGLEPKGARDNRRIYTKLWGLVVSLLLMLALYFLIPEYEKGVYKFPLQVMGALMVPVIIGGWLYFEEFDSRLDNPYDGYWHFGRFAFGRWQDVDWSIIRHHARSLLLRFYFLPVMLMSFMYTLLDFTEGANNSAHEYLADISDTPGLDILQALMFAYFVLASIDVLFASIGYLMTFRVLDTDIRSVEPTVLGWVVCLICYYPFFDLFLVQHILYDFYHNPTWYEWFDTDPVFMVIWGVCVVFFMCSEALTTLTFGFRFSNLTYRGLISSGPFQITKHPQYISKMLNRFFFFVPFLSLNGVFGALETLGLFSIICFIYFLRARTEENHLSRYPEYVEYANWINENGAFRHIGRLLPFLVYSEEKARAGKLF